MRGIYIDIETGGLRPESDAILQIGAIAFEQKGDCLNATVMDNIHITVPDNLYICRRALQVQGKTFADVDKRRGPYPQTEERALEVLHGCLTAVLGHRVAEWDRSMIWAHYAPFDAGFLHHMEKRVGLDTARAANGVPPIFPLEHGWSCTKAYWKRLQSEGKAPSEVPSGLDSLAAHFGIYKPIAHDAMGDCEVGIQVLQQMLRIEGRL